MQQVQMGKVLAVNISDKKGMRKTNVRSCAVVKNFGLKGDAHAGPWHRQVSLLANESIEKMRAMGLDVGFGDFAENITTEGIDLVHLPIGTIIRIGNSVALRVSQIGKVCHERCAIYYQAGDCVMPKEGIFGEVVTEGEVKVGDEIFIDDDGQAKPYSPPPFSMGGSGWGWTKDFVAPSFIEGGTVPSAINADAT